MADLNTGKIATVIFENMLETYTHQSKLLERVMFYMPSAAEMQNSNNLIWRPVQQHAPIMTGWSTTDATLHKTGIIEQTYPATLGEPKNDFVEIRADDLRDPVFWERRGKQSGMQQATYLNRMIANAIKDEGSLFYRATSSTENGYNHIASAETMMAEREVYDSGKRTFILNNRDTQKFANDLASRQTVQGRPEEAWAYNQIGSNVAGFDVFTGSYLPTILGPNGAISGISTVDADDFDPRTGSVSTTGVVTNVDYRSMSISIKGPNASRLKKGDKITLAGVNSIAKASKVDTGQLMTFTITAKASNTSITISPVPIKYDEAQNSGALGVLKNAYSNTMGDIVMSTAINVLNTDVSKRTNVFFDQSAVEVLGGSVPASLFKSFNGHKVITERMPNGQELYMLYGGNIDDMTFKFRCFTWWGVTIANPEACGVSVTI